jgi:uncharacterized protein YacL
VSVSSETLLAALLALLALNLLGVWLLWGVRKRLSGPSGPGAANGPNGARSTAATTARLKLVDTSAWIDGRLSAIAAAHFLEGPLATPKSVLTELQRIADSEDAEKRRRGRRGLELVEQATQAAANPARILDDDNEQGSVDARLVRLCLKHKAALVTTDFNLQRVAEAQGVTVLNLHALAHALRRTLQPGERVAVTLVRGGREAGQGLGYLEDGTMLVVEDAAHRIGETLEVVVARTRQTSMGHMAFARVAGAPLDPAPPPA